MERHQGTIKRSVRFIGIGLHSGRQVTLDVLPATPGTGIVFQRTDLAGAEPIAAHYGNISSTDLCTTIGHGANSVSTIEHLMAAFAGLGIDNAFVRIDAAEVPILDGSAAPFVDKLLAAGIAKVGGARHQLVVKEAFEVRQGDKFMRVEPSSTLEFDCSIDFASAAIGRQHLAFTFSRSNFLDLCDSRTFCHSREVDALRAAGLALGGSLENAIVVTDTDVMNSEGLRSKDEFVRHKLLDCIGDLALLGAPLVGKVTLSKGGHALHARFMKEMMARQAELIAVVAESTTSTQQASPAGVTRPSRVAATSIQPR